MNINLHIHLHIHPYCSNNLIEYDKLLAPCNTSLKSAIVRDLGFLNASIRSLTSIDISCGDLCLQVDKLNEYIASIDDNDNEALVRMYVQIDNQYYGCIFISGLKIKNKQNFIEVLNGLRNKQFFNFKIQDPKTLKSKLDNILNLLEYSFQTNTYQFDDNYVEYEAICKL